MLRSMLALSTIDTGGLDAIDAVVVALIIALATGFVTCYFAISAFRHGYGTVRNSVLIASGVLCGLSIGFAVVVWLIVNGGS